jgi:hypothetical protein
VNDAPELVIGAPGPVTAGAASAGVVGSAAALDVDGTGSAGAVIALGAGRQPDDSIAVEGFALNVVSGRTMVGDTGIELVGGGFDAGIGQLVLSGNAPPETYASVMAGLRLVNGSGGVLEAGERSISITLSDPAGATDTETVSVTVTPSVLQGDGSDATLQGTAASDTFHASAGDETMRGDAGNDFFLLSPDASNDLVDGGAGFDTLELAGVAGGPFSGAPAANGFQLVLDTPDQAATAGSQSLDFAEPVSGHIVFGDGSQVDFTGIERITW